MSTADLAVIRRIQVGADPQGLSVSADGRYAYVSAGATGELWMVDLDDGTTVARAGVGARPIGVLHV